MSATKSVGCYITSNTGTITIKNFYQQMTNSILGKYDALKLTFNEDFYNILGGYLPSGQLGTCTILAFNNSTNTIGEYNGIVYFYNDAINIIPDDENYPSKVYWCGKSMDGNPEIGIVSMTIEFEIQKTKPDYKDLRPEEIFVPPVGGDTTITDGGDEEGYIKDTTPGAK